MIAYIECWQVLEGERRNDWATGSVMALIEWPTVSSCGCVKVTRNRSPIYTMRPQIYIRPMFVTPAPNAYRAEDVVLHKPTIFHKSFGLKHSVFAGAMVNKVTSQCRMVYILYCSVFRCKFSLLLSRNLYTGWPFSIPNQIPWLFHDFSSMAGDISSTRYFNGSQFFDINYYRPATLYHYFSSNG